MLWAAEEVLIIKSKIHRDFNAMVKVLQLINFLKRQCTYTSKEQVIDLELGELHRFPGQVVAQVESTGELEQEIPNPVYLFQGVEFRRGAKGTGIKSIELAVSMCDQVDIYGFTVDPGYADWTRYFSEPRRGHNPLQGRAYYQLLECLGVSCLPTFSSSHSEFNQSHPLYNLWDEIMIEDLSLQIIKIHSPMREEEKQDWSLVPSRQLLVTARTAAFQLKKLPAKVKLDPYAACGLWATARRKAGPISGKHL